MRKWKLWKIMKEKNRVGHLGDRGVNQSLNDEFWLKVHYVIFSSWKPQCLLRFIFLLNLILRKKNSDFWFLIYSLNFFGRFSLLLCSCKRGFLLEANIAVETYSFLVFVIERLMFYIIYSFFVIFFHSKPKKCISS